jgi:hypothetical protein
VKYGVLLSAGLLALSACTVILPTFTTQKIPPDRRTRLSENLKALGQQVGTDLVWFGQDNAPQTDVPWWAGMVMRLEPLTTEAHIQRLESLVDTGLLARELGIYPTGFFPQVGPELFVFGRHLQGGFLSVWMDIHGMGLKWAGRRLAFIDITSSTAQRGSDASYLLQHELFHTLDPYMITGNREWEACNLQPFAYGQRPSQTYFPRPGFVSDYALTFPSEDRAELFSFLVSNPVRAQLVLARMAVGDRHLSCKYQWLQKFMADVSPAFNERWWRYLALGLRGPVLHEAIVDPLQVQSLDLSVDPEAGLNALKPEERDSLGWLPHGLAMPESLGDFKALKHLTMDNHGYAQVPEAVGELTQLESLSLRGHRFVQFPAPVLKLTQLKTLHLVTGAFTALPDLSSLNQLEQLTLVLDGSAGRTFAQLSQLFRLEELTLFGSQLKQLPESLLLLGRLRSLTLHTTGIQILPSWLGSLKALRRLEIKETSLEGEHPLPLFAHVNLADLAALEELRLDDIADLKLLSLKGLNALRFLSLKGYLSPELPDGLYELPALQELDITGFTALSLEQQSKLKAWAQTRGIKLIGL